MSCEKVKAVDIAKGYLQAVSKAIAEIPASDVSTAADALFQTWIREGTVFLVGNGGSAATASHLMNDLTKLTRVPGQRPFKAMALTDNVPLMTAWANDDEFANIFVEQLRTFIRPVDLVLAMSTSGNSPNLVRALEFARGQGAATVAFTGRSGGRLKECADICICVPCDDIGQQEDAHMVVSHVMAYSVRALLTAHAGVSQGNPARIA